MLDNFRVRLTSVAPVILRIALGVIFIYHGWPKVIATLEGINPLTAVFGEHFPLWLAAAASWTELLAGFFLLAGLLTRFWAAGLTIEMAVAVFAVHWPYGFNVYERGAEYAFLCAMSALAVFLLGPGALSLDYLIGRWWRKENANAVVGCGMRFPAHESQERPGEIRRPDTPVPPPQQ